MSRSGEVKVGDFGLMRVRAGISGGGLVSCRGGTLEYCSPEQMGGGYVDRRTDIWSLGVSMVEMFRGRADWGSGVEVPGVLEGYVGGARGGWRLGIPEDVVEVLRGCFKVDCGARWGSMIEVASRLREAYERRYGRYEREEPGIRKAPGVALGEDLLRVGVLWRDPLPYLREALRLDGRSDEEVDRRVAGYIQGRGGSLKSRAVSDMACYGEVIS
ncbi:MAG: protein kinase, partial [Candidatus Bathyarchaeia archaeon]